MKVSKEDFDFWFSYGCSLRTRTLWLGSMVFNDEATDNEPGIYWNTARRLIQSLHILDNDRREPITILMSSCGGDWSHGMAMYDAIKACRNHVTIINMSHARSMTSLIFQAGDLRITAPHSYYMIHDGVLGVYDHPRTVFAHADYEKFVCLPEMYQIYLDRLQETNDVGEPLVDIKVASEILNGRLPGGAESIKPSRGIKGIRLKHIEQLCTRDTFFTPQEMVRLNFADRLLESNDLAGAYANPKMHSLPGGLESLDEE